VRVESDKCACKSRSIELAHQLPDLLLVDLTPCSILEATLRMHPHVSVSLHDFGGRGRDRTGDPLLAKTRKKIYLIGSLGFVLCRSTWFCT
jgi:hypothetical protein